MRKVWLALPVRTVCKVLRATLAHKAPSALLAQQALKVIRVRKVRLVPPVRTVCKALRAFLAHKAPSARLGQKVIPVIKAPSA